MTKKILLVGGSSGGHAYPLLAVAKALRFEAKKNNINLELMFLGVSGFLDKVAQEGGIPFKRVMAGGLRRYFDPRIILDVIKIPISFIQAFWHLFWFMPDVIFCKGGYDSVAPAIVGRIYFIPVYVHESDSMPGLANRIIAKLARAIFIGFRSAEKYFPKEKTIFVGNPVRSELLSGSKAEALQFFNFSDGQRTILVLGGSQGAKQINEIIINSLVSLAKDYQIIHQTGESQFGAVRKEVDRIITEGDQAYGSYVRKNYRGYPFLDTKTLALAYALADCIISRAGAGSLFEIATLGKPSIVIPLAQATRGEQLSNAAEFSRFGGIIVEGENMTPNIIMNQIQSALENSVEISQKIKSFATPDAVSVIASALLTQ